MEPAAPIECAYLFLPLQNQLGVLLGSLSTEDWQRPSVCAGWRVRDIAAHLLDVDLRRLSFARDNMVPPAAAPPPGYGELVRFLNHLNGDWVETARLRLSPRLLTDLLALTGPQVAGHMAGLDMNAPARFPVAWAGDAVSPNWFDVGREYTERWHHQQQIRDAVGAPGLSGRFWLFPVLDVFMRALPFTYRDTTARPGDAVAFHIEGDAGGDWSLLSGGEGWMLFHGAAEDPVCRIALDQDAAWRLFTKGLCEREAAACIRVQGDSRLGAVFRGSLAVMA